MNYNNRDAGLTPVGFSLLGAIGVTAAYWIHLILLELPIIDDTGVSITIFAASFIAQYVPLKLIDSQYLLEEKLDD